jgi:glycosyltransferase involved in cell wall biosynthesis
MTTSTHPLVDADRASRAEPPPIGARKLLSIVVPVYNEEANVDILYNVVNETLACEAERYDLELVFTDNHSTDDTFARLAAIAARDRRVRVYRFSRNFGYQLSIFTGYGLARGAVAVQLDADLQDPPRLIIEFLRLWEQGYQVVYGIRRERKEGWLIRSTRGFFYWLVDVLSNDNLPRDAGDFRLIDRRIIDELKRIRDPNIYIRGRIAAMGFRQIGIHYSRDERLRGLTKFNIGALFSLALDGITSHSVMPLRIATLLGVVATSVAGLMMVGYPIARFVIGSNWPPGFTTLTVLLTLSIGINSLLLGVIGEYLARMYQHLKLSPKVIIETSVSAEPSAERDPGEM